MRKSKVSIKGIITLLNESGQIVECPMHSLGDLLKPNFGGMLNGSLINNRMFLMELQSEGLKLSKTFHYKDTKNRNEQRIAYLEQGKQVLERVLKDNYGVVPTEIQLSLHEDYDVDYCELSLEEIKADLTPAEILEVLQESKNYKPTTKTNRKMNVFFG